MVDTLSVFLGRVVQLWEKKRYLQSLTSFSGYLPTAPPIPTEKSEFDFYVLHIQPFRVRYIMELKKHLPITMLGSCGEGMDSHAWK